MTITDTSQYHSKDIMEFVTVGFEFCKRIENVNSTKRKDFIDSMLKILPLLYVKSQIVLNFQTDEDFYLEHIVTEADYNAIQNSIADTMSTYDDLADFLYVFKQDNEESTYAALCEISDSFAERWGQILVNVMRPLHETKYNVHSDIYQEVND